MDLNLSIDYCVNMNAVFYYNEKHKKDPPIVQTKQEKFAERVLLTKIKMFDNKEWYTYLMNKATKLNISIDSCMNMDARWQTQNDIFEEQVLFYKAQIRNTPKWLKDVEAKAKEWKISTDSCITLDARYMASEDLKKKLLY